LSGEVLRRPPLGRRLAVGLGGAAVVAAMAVGGAWLALHVDDKPASSAAAPAPKPAPEAEARRLLDAGDLDGAGKVLAQARARFDSSELQELYARWSEQRGNRLAALAHLERASRLAPTDARPRGRLADLLYRMGQKRDACRAADAALKLDPSGARAPDARTVFTQARCKEVP
jgi:tetratricopeptide (TPR) repeat protein